jgi:hypothetical protein
LINKGLFLLSEADGFLQEDKKKFVWDIAANNPHFFPQDGAITVHIYFHAPLTIRGTGECAILPSKKGPRKPGLCAS